VNGLSTQILNSPFVSQRERGYRRLLFSDFVEEEFRQYYSKISVQRAQLLLALTIVALFLTTSQRIANGISNPYMLWFYVVIMLPVLTVSLYASTKLARHRLFQLLLACSVTLIGLVICSFVSRAAIGGQSYYFGALISWIFVNWLILGMPFRHAARTATIISCIYIWGMFKWDFPADEALFACIMLVFTNFVAAYCCYQLEFAVRRSFLESKVLGQLAERDGLTSLYNRRSYDEYIDRIWRQSRREQTQLTVMLIDIDHFKAFNDYYGHQAGDDALKKVAMIIADGAQRPLDFAARFGGEEFSLVLYGPANEAGHELPEHLREGVEALKIRHEKSTTAQYLTVSVGVAIVTPGGERSKAGAIQMADEALYQAKEEGRNCVVVKKSLDTDIQTGRFRSSKKVLT
jgi:diguanylate cyclase (GGDEF)-like protein